MPALSSFLLGAGILLEGGSQVFSASSRAHASEQDAILKNEQADEVIRRAGVRTELMQDQQRQLEGAQVTSAVSSGFTLQGSPLLLMEASQKRINREIDEMNKDAQFQAEQLRRGADISSEMASDITTAGWIGAGGSVLGGASKFYRQKTGKADVLGSLNTAPV